MTKSTSNSALSSQERDAYDPRAPMRGSLVGLSLVALSIAALSCSSKAEERAAPVVVREDPCSLAGAQDDTRCGPVVPPYEGSHPLDAVMHPLFFKAGHTPKPAGSAELCRRLGADLLGRYPSADQIAADCEGRGVDAIARDYQARPDYLVASERRWRDRLGTSDVSSDWRYLKDLYAQVDRLHRGGIRYPEFVIAALSHPAFILSEPQPGDRVRLAFRAFLGRQATDAEAADLASLYRPWLPRSQPDPDFPYIMSNKSAVLPILCEPLLHCTATLMGGGRVDLRGAGSDFIPYERLTAAQLDTLREIGRVFVRQPYFYEAAADEILSRYLGWSDGGRFPREPGVIVPGLREALARELERTGDYPAAERLVLTSWLYRQTAEVAPDGLGDDPTAVEPPVWTSGPVKAATPEIWLDSAARLTFDLGTCDPRYGDNFTMAKIYMAVQTGTLAASRQEAELRKLHLMEENRMPFRRFDQQTEAGPDFRYFTVARGLGGCPGFAAKRSGPDGIAYAFTQEAYAELLCAAGAVTGLLRPAAATTLEPILTHQMRLLLGRSPTAQERADLITAKDGCTGDDCTPDGIARSVCVGLLGSATMLFY